MSGTTAITIQNQKEDSQSKLEEEIEWINKLE